MNKEVSLNFFDGTEDWLRASHLLDKHSITWAMPPALESCLDWYILEIAHILILWNNLQFFYIFILLYSWALMQFLVLLEHPQGSICLLCPSRSAWSSAPWKVIPSFQRKLPVIFYWGIYCIVSKLLFDLWCPSQRHGFSSPTFNKISNACYVSSHWRIRS